MSLAEALEALLFVAAAPARIEELAAALDQPREEVEDALKSLAAQRAAQGGLQVVRLAGGYQLATKPELAESVARFLKPQRQKLSRTLLEVLAIVAYRQPITLAEVDAARGVQSEYAVKQLVERRLLREVGRRPSPGRPLLYGTTQQFLHQFNLDDIDSLPPLASDPPELPG